MVKAPCWPKARACTWWSGPTCSAVPCPRSTWSRLRKRWGNRHSAVGNQQSVVESGSADFGFSASPTTIASLPPVSLGPPTRRLNASADYRVLFMPAIHLNGIDLSLEDLRQVVYNKVPVLLAPD